jgi:Family of unknown function (DUF6580)
MRPEQKKQASIEHAFSLRVGIAVTLILLAAVLRIVPHPWNLTPIGAMALFSGSMFRKPWIAFLLPLASLFAGDVFADFHKLMIVVYASFAVSVAIGRWLGENRTVVRVGGAVFAGALQFFAVTNFAVWAIGAFYPKTAAGLAACFAAGVPYFWNTLAGDALYAGVFFGGFALAQRILGPLPEHGEEAQT